MNPILQRDIQHARASPSDFRVLFESVPSPLLVILPDDPLFTIVTATDAFVRITGIRREDLIGQGMFEVFPETPDNPDAGGIPNVRASLLRAIATQAPDRLARYRYDFALPAGEFEERYWHSVTSPILAADGGVAYLLYLVEEELDRAETRFHQVAETSTWGLIIGGLAGAVSYLNQTARELLGYSEEEVTRGLVRLDQLTPPEFAVLDAEAERQLAATGRCALYEKMFIARNGGCVPILIGASVLGKANGRTEMAAFFLDLTARKLRDTAFQASQVRQALMLDLLRGQRKTSDPVVMMQAAAEAVGRYLDVDRVGFFEVRGDTLDFSVGWTRGRLPLLLGHDFPAIGIGSRYLEQVRAGRTLGISDASTDPLTADSLFHEIGTVSLVGVPIIRNGRWHAGFYVNHSEIRHWTKDEIALVRDVGEQTWDAIERARAEAALRKSEERLTFALDAGGAVGTWDWDIPGDRVCCDVRLAHLFSVDPEHAAAGAPLSAFVDNIHPDDRARVSESIRQAVNAGGDFAEEYRVMQKDGAMRWVYARGHCHLDGAGHPTRFPGVVFDITDHRRAEAHLHQQWHTFDTALSNTPDFTYIFDLDGRFTYVNRALLALWQRSHEEAVGKNFFDLGYPLELAERLHRQIQQVIDTKEPLRDQTPFTGPTGETRHYEYIFVPVFAPDGEVQSVTGSTRDVTDRRTAEDELRRMNRELEEFAYVASHDLQEPLRMVNIYTQLILKSLGGEDAKLDNYAGFVRQGVQRMEGLIRDLLTFSRITHDSELPASTADLSVSLNETLSVFKNRIEESGAAITAQTLPTVRGDAPQMAHVFQNLLSNALKYRKKNVPPEIQIAAEPDGEQWTISVRDNGIGFDPQYAERIFGLFKRLHRDEYPGTGLGLAICQRIVERYGGRMWAEGRPGDGATFYFTLPKT
jgi:PAS domain S-box-containing protein